MVGWLHQRNRGVSPELTATIYPNTVGSRNEVPHLVYDVTDGLDKMLRTRVAVTTAQLSSDAGSVACPVSYSAVGYVANELCGTVVSAVTGILWLQSDRVQKTPM